MVLTWRGIQQGIDMLNRMTRQRGDVSTYSALETVKTQNSQISPFRLRTTPPRPPEAMNNRKNHNHSSTHQNKQISKTQAPTKKTHSSNTAAPAHHHFLWLSLIATSIKLLLIPAYHSTDFEVHRNWLAITHSLPLSQWYSDETSPWTLDYPPFFAYFERFLSFFASLVDPTMVHLTNGLNYKSHLTILFQRLSVIISDSILLYGIYRITRKIDPKERSLIWVLVIGAPGLIIVDHLHFQYNGFLLGILLLSLAALEDGEDLMGGFLFASLLCFKHLFAVSAPVYFVYLLRHYCRGGLVKGFGTLVVMGSVVVAVFAAAYGPFLYCGQVFFYPIYTLLGINFLFVVTLGIFASNRG